MATDGLPTTIDFGGEPLGIRATFEVWTPASGGRGEADGSAGVGFATELPSHDLESALFAAVLAEEALILRGSESA